jgi:hypothetical protein
MRVNRSMQFLTILATFTACGAPAADATPAAAAEAAPVAAAPVPAPDPAPAAGVNVRWDSGPLDIAYRRERSDMDARFKVEIATPRAGESAAQRNTRQASESRALESRYTRGKADHARSLPPA